MRLVLGHFHSLFFYATLCTAGLLNRTIDDESGDEVTGLKPRYIPDGNTWSQGASCKQCSVTLSVDAEQVFNRTWHDTTYSPENLPGGVAIEASFNGTAVYVFNIISNTLPNTSVTFTDLSFYIDDYYVGAFIHNPDPTAPEILYHVPVYTNNSLTDDEHTIRMLASGNQDSLVLFDYIVYTTGDNEPSPPNPSDHSTAQSKSAILAGSIVGAAVGAIVALLTLSITLYLLHRRGRLVLPLFDKSHPGPLARLGPNSCRTSTWEVNSRSSLLSSIRTPRSTSPLVSSIRTPTSTSPLVSSIRTPTSTSPLVSSNEGDTTPPLVRSNAPGAAIIAPSPHCAERAITPLSNPPAHRADVPIPALSTAGTDQSLHLAGLMEEIRELEESLRDVQGEKTQRGPRRADRVVSIADMRDRLMHLRAQLEKERRLMAEAFPREREKRVGAANAEAVAAVAAGMALDVMAGLEDKVQPRRKRHRKGKPRELRVVS